MVNWGELVIAAAVVVERFERKIAVGANKDRRRPRACELYFLWLVHGGGDAAVAVARSASQCSEKREIGTTLESERTEWLE